MERFSDLEYRFGVFKGSLYLPTHTRVRRWSDRVCGGYACMSYQIHIWSIEENSHMLEIKDIMGHCAICMSVVCMDSMFDSFCLT